MKYLNNNAKERKCKYLKYEERIKIEILNKIGMKSEKIAAEKKYDILKNSSKED